MNDCLFCKIIAGQIPSNKVYEDEFTYAFHDIAPQAKVHVLVVSKKHTPDAAHNADLTDQELAQIPGQIAAYHADEDLVLEGDVNRVLNPGGGFIFDVNTPEKLQAMDGQIFLDEDDDVYCVWRGEFDYETNICTYGMDIFQRKD